MMRKIFVTILMMCVLVSPTLSFANVSSSNNYVVSVNPLDTCQSVMFSNGILGAQAGVRIAASVNYYDEQGRNHLSILKSASPNRDNLVLYTEIDDNHRILRQWLPLSTQSSQPQSSNTMKAAIIDQYSDSHPYRTIEKENRKGGRVLRETAPGETYQSHPSSFSYGVCENDILRIRCIDGGFSVDGTYAAGSLRTTTHTDADGKMATSVLDSKDRQICLMLGQESKTYYVYDELGRLRYQLPSAVVSRLSSNQVVSDSEDYIQQYAYIYRYDRWGNMISKKLPGVEWQYMTYDQAGRLISMQDGNQRARGEYRVQIQYDDYNRVVATKEVCESTSFEKALSESWYDSYAALSAFSAEIAGELRFVQEDGFETPIEHPLGLRTISAVYHLSDSGYTVVASYYNSLKRIVQQRSINTDGSQMVRSVRYNLDGTVHAEKVAYQIMGESIVEVKSYTYDHVGRLLQEWSQVNGQSPVLMVENQYDNHGLLVKKLRYNRRDSIDYDYDLRQSLTLIASNAFTEQLYYADSIPNLLTACYNGSIAGSMVSHGDSLYRFAYAYDALNRLTRASRVFQDSLVLSEGFVYDEMGNILNLHRNDLEGNPLDVLQYDYVGNQVLSITDQQQSRDEYNVKEYLDWSDNPQAERQYDANGNLVADSDRGIVRIVYNLLNLPDSVIFADSSMIVNTYDAAGIKLSSDYLVSIHKEMITGATDGTVFADTIVDTRRSVYWGGLELHFVQSYPNNLVFADCMLHHSEGYIQGTIDGAGDESLDYYYYYHDHLGNVRTVWNATADTIVQRTCYYASGLPMAVSVGLGVQPYLYNGKEFVQMHGYDVFDYGFRGYYAATGQFTSIDPLCEQTPWQSPYVYANNNPICNVDWMGLSASMFSGNYGTCNWVAINTGGVVIGYDMDSDDTGVYLVDDYDWDGSYKDLYRYLRIGQQIDGFVYEIGGQGAYMVYESINHVASINYILPEIVVCPTKRTNNDDISCGPLFPDLFNIITSYEPWVRKSPVLRGLKSMGTPLLIAQYIQAYDMYRKGDLDFNTGLFMITATIGNFGDIKVKLAMTYIDCTYIELSFFGKMIIDNIDYINAYWGDYATYGNRYLYGEW